MFFGIALVLAAYMAPGIIALLRGHRQRGAIFTLNLLLGWTVLGWIISLVWSVSAARPAVVILGSEGDR